MGKKTISENKKIVIKSLVDSGMSYRTVREVVGVSLGLITKIVKVFDSNKDLIAFYREHKLEFLQRAQGENLLLQQAIRDTLTEDEIRKLTPDQKARWFAALGVDHGIKFDKERIQSDLSTDNVSVVVKMIKQLKASEPDGG
jgi:transposase